MKTPRPSMLAIAALALCAAASQAHAATVNFSGNDWDFGTVAVGQSGAVTTNPNTSFYEDASNNPQTVYDLGYGFLPSNSEITFTYTITPPASGSVEANGSYSFVAGNSLFTISSSNGVASETRFNLSNNTLTVLPPPATLPVVTSANITGGTGTTIIKNLSNSVASFSSFFLSAIAPGSNLKVTYNVSSVPLPETLVLFGSALVALAGLSFYRRRA